ncbi:vesicular glutamate transporter 2-like [Planococcus citri]|uniref:vesicular glutamate transporter 2-like n=1 Tax=Planococcus citri TaxID=170843 RepID=UPI0031F7910A
MITQVTVDHLILSKDSDTEITRTPKLMKNMQQDTKMDPINDHYVAEKLIHEKNGEKIEKAQFWFSKRFLITVLMFFGYINVVTLKANLNIAVIDMTSKKLIIIGNDTTYEQPEFDWNSQTTGFILGMYAYGYQTCLASGYVINKLGGAITFGGGIMLMSVLNIITPAILKANFYLFLASRIIIGSLDGFTYTGIMEILARWAPIQERSTMSSLGFNGIYIGIAATYPICGFLAFHWGWKSTFYVAGIVGIIWSFIWLPVVKNHPSKDKWISKKELMYILNNTETTARNKIRPPYKKIFKSPAVWALCVCQFVYNWGFTLLVTCFPIYVKDMTGRSIDEVGMIASIPNLVCMFMVPLAGVLMDFWQNNSNLTRSQIHKIMTSLGFLTGSISFAIAAYSTSFTLSMICFVVIKMMISFNFLLLHLVCLGMSPNHTGALAGIAAFWHTVSVILVPNMVGFIVQDHTLEEWSICFLISAAVLLMGTIVFVIYGSSELQPWSVSLPSNVNDVNEKPNVENENFNKT